MYKEEEMSLEYFDILDEEGNKTGKIKLRKESLSQITSFKKV